MKVGVIGSRGLTVNNLGEISAGGYNGDSVRRCKGH